MMIQKQSVPLNTYNWYIYKYVPIKKKNENRDFDFIYKRNVYWKALMPF